MAKDAKGFLWLGTATGLSRYDGYGFQNFAFAKYNELIGHVNVIKTDKQNRLWIGTGAGLFCLAGNEIIKISAATSLPQGVNDILPDINNDIWLATENGPAKINLSDVDLTGNKKITLPGYLLKQWQQHEVSDKLRAVLISKAADGTVYIASSNALFRFLNNQLEMLYYITDSRNKITSLFPVNKSIVYFDAASTEINKIENGVITSSSPLKLYKPPADSTAEGIWYVGTRGAFCFHPQTGTITTYVTLDDDNLVWPTAILKEHGFFWVASHEGLIKLKPSLFGSYGFDRSSTYNDYYSITELKNKKLLLGANFGKIFEKNGNSFIVYKDKLLPSAEIKDIYEDEKGWLWLASGYQGVVLIRDNNTEHFTTENGLHDNALSQFVKTSNGKLFVVGDAGMSEVIISGKTVSFKKYYYPPNISQSAKFSSGIAAPDGSVWMGGEEGIVCLQNDTLHKFSLNGNYTAVNYLLKDNKENVWIATAGGGILQGVFNKSNKLEIVKQFTEGDGLNTMHYLSLLADSNNNIWAASSRGITVIEQAGKGKSSILNFDESDGFIKAGYSTARLHQDSQGNIWAATTLGVTSFKPYKLLAQFSSPLIYITMVRGTKTNQVIKNFSDDHGKFSYNNNSFNFSFTALDYANPEGMRYYYKLDGVDTNWTNGESLRSISYENLSPGKYTFHVKALNRKGRWSEKNAVYYFVVNTPFWQTWWFRLLTALIVIALAAYYFRRRVSIIETKAAIKQQMTELEVKALRAQMNPHFIFNAMNSIQQFTLNNDIDNANRYISRFSTLLRKVLHTSQQKLISLEEEIEQLNLYLEIEQLRLGDSFQYHLEVEDDIETEAVKIPGMLIQPFVENALKHGLSPKPGSENIDHQIYSCC